MASAVGENDPGPRATATPLPPAQDRQMDGAYEIASEAPPSHPFFEPAIAAALKFDSEARSMILQKLEQIREHCPNAPGLADLKEDCLKRMRYPTRRLALVGDSGHGKSSLINSLLHIPNIALASSRGGACTSVVIEYHQKQDDQTSPIDITVEFYAGVALERFVTDMAFSYRQFYKDNAREQEESLGGLDATEAREDFAERQRQSAVAGKALEAAFKHHAGWSTEFLLDMSSGSDDRVNNQLIQWAHAIEWPTGGKTTEKERSTEWRYSVNTVEECAKMTLAFMKDKLWPFTKVIKTYLSSPLLETGLILADLPGFRDSNEARVEASRNYLRKKCKDTLIVGRIDRITTDESIQNHIKAEAGRLHESHQKDSGKQPRITVVCTASDLLDEDESEFDFVGEGKPISKKRWQELQTDLNAAKVSGDASRRDAVELRIWYTLAAARDEDTKENLKKKYERETRTKIDVFCVGNSMYKKYCKVGDARRVQATGIPALRRHCHRLMADDQLAKANFWTKTAMPGLFYRAEAFAHSMLSDVRLADLEKKNISEGLKKIRDEVPNLISKAFNSGVEIFWGEFMATWTANQNNWAETARLESLEWEKWPWPSYNAWLRRGGEYITRSRGHVNWNQLMTRTMRGDLDDKWDDVLANAARLQLKIEGVLADSLGRFKENTFENVPETEKTILTSAINTMILTLRHDMEEVFKKFEHAVLVMKIQSQKMDSSSYIAREMRLTYRKAFLDRGRGVFARQKACVAEKLNSGTLFPNMAETMTKDLTKQTNKATEALEALTRKAIFKLVHNFDMVLNPKRTIASAESSVMELHETVEKLRGAMAGLKPF